MERLNESRRFPLVALILGAFAIAWVAPTVTQAAPAWQGTQAPPYEVQVVVDGVPLQEHLHKGTLWVEGRKDRRYALRLINRTGRRVEVVASVDGLDVVDGKPGDYTRKRGYVLGPWQTYDVEGFRLDMGRVAAFRFSTVADSYAAQTGSARNVGVIGVAFFEERRPPAPPRRPQPMAPRTRGVFGESGAAGERWDGDDLADALPAEEFVTSQGDAESGMGPASKSSAQASAAPARGRAAGAASVDSVESAGAPRRMERPGLGTSFGESRQSVVSETRFVRANPGTPTRVVVLKYNDRKGLVAQGVIVERRPPSDTWQRATADPFPAAPRHRRFAQPPRGWDE